LRHVNILNIHGYCAESLNYCIVIEFAKGGSLYDWLEDKQRILQDQLKLQFCKQAVTAVNYLHHQQILHRDIKSLNFMVGEQQVLKLGDFGLAKVKDVCSTLSTVKSKSKSIGTVRWRAPETFDDEPKWTEKADIFSLGMTLYEILTRKLPFDTERDAYAIPMRIVNGKRPAIPMEFQNHPLVAVIALAWQQDPQQRLTAEKLMTMLPTNTQEDEMRFFDWIDTRPLVFRKIIDNLDTAGSGRNWETLAGELEYTLLQIQLFGRKESPAKALMNDWMPKKEATLKKLHEILEKMDQHTIIEILNKD
jgi:serine/threonine protein kinase